MAKMVSNLCEVDVDTQSLFGSPCGRRLQDGQCPVHGTTGTSIHDHPDPNVREVAEGLTRIQRILDGRREH